MLFVRPLKSIPPCHSRKHWDGETSAPKRRSPIAKYALRPMSIPPVAFAVQTEDRSHTSGMTECQPAMTCCCLLLEGQTGGEAAKGRSDLTPRFDFSESMLQQRHAPEDAILPRVTHAERDFASERCLTAAQRESGRCCCVESPADRVACCDSCTVFKASLVTH